MEVILEELRKNGMEIDMKTLSYHINNVLERHELLYQEMMTRTILSELPTVFVEMYVNNFGRAMAYLSLIYLINGPENVTRPAVRLVDTPLKKIDFTAFRIEESFFRRTILYMRRKLSL